MNLAFRLARREMRSGLGGFRLFIACLALGVAAIAAILSFSRAVEEGLRADAREILGGDVAVSLLYREATPEQIDYMKSRGRARALDRQPRHGAAGQARRAGDPGAAQGGRAGLSALRQHRAQGRPARSPTRWPKSDGVWGAVVEESALRRMNMALGERAEGGRRHRRGARHHRPRARPRAERLREPGAAPHDLLRGGVGIGAGAARQPVELRISPAPAAGHLRRRRHRRR